MTELSESERRQLNEKLKKHLPMEEDEIGGGCIQSAVSLHDKKGGGEIYWVGNIKTGEGNESLQHAYYVPPDSNDTDVALNQADAGYANYPPLSVKEVRSIGQPQNVQTLKGIVGKKK